MLTAELKQEIDDPPQVAVEAAWGWAFMMRREASTQFDCWETDEQNSVSKQTEGEF